MYSNEYGTGTTSPGALMTQQSDKMGEPGRTHQVLLSDKAGITKVYEAVTQYCGFSAIEAGKTIDKLFIEKGLHNDLFAELWKLVRLKRINYKHVPLEKINRLTRKNHQGVFAFISPIDFHNIEDISLFFIVLSLNIQCFSSYKFIRICYI